MNTVTGILLAAGSSSRFGSNKLQFVLESKEAIAVQACRHLMAGTDHVIAIVRPGSTMLGSMMAEMGAEVVVCQNAQRGMGASLACGIATSQMTGGWLVALADMPWIEPTTIIKIAEAIRQGCLLAAPFYQGKRGHPVGFSYRLKSELMALDSDTGAKILLQKYASQLIRIDCNDAGILKDVDSPEDLTADLLASLDV